MAKKGRLGRGLDSLIPDLPEETPAQGAAQEIPLKKIELNPKQPRLQMDPDELQQLADSIKAQGLIQPITVRKKGKMYELVVGERRLRATHMAGLEAIPALVRDVPDEKMLEIALIENIQRADLNAIEKAKAVHQMIEELELTQEEAGWRLGLNRTTVTNMLRLLDLSGDLQEMVSRGTISAGHARALLQIDSRPMRMRVARRIVEKGLSVRETERLAARQGGTIRESRVHEPSPDVARLEEQLSEALGTRVQIRQGKRGGRLVVRFRNNDDFERIYETITGRTTEDEFIDRISA